MLAAARTNEPSVNCKEPPPDGATGACACPANAAGSTPICCRALVENGAGASPFGVHLASSAAAVAIICVQTVSTRSWMALAHGGSLGSRERRARTRRELTRRHAAIAFRRSRSRNCARAPS